MCTSFVIWYIVDGKTGGVIPMLCFFLFVEFYFLLRFPRCIVIALLSMVTQILVVGYELQVRKVGEKVSVHESCKQYSYLLLVLGRNEQRTARVSDLPPCPLSSCLRFRRNGRRFLLDFLPLPSHSSLATPQRSRRFPLPPCQLLQLRPHHSWHANSWRRWEPGRQIQSWQEIGKSPQQGLYQGAQSTRWLASTLVFHQLGTHVRWQVPQGPVRRHHPTSLAVGFALLTINSGSC